MERLKSVFTREESFQGEYGCEYYGPFNYEVDDEVEVCCDIIEILEGWDCEYEYVDDEKGMTWLRTRTYYEPGSIIEDFIEDVNRSIYTSYNDQ